MIEELRVQDFRCFETLRLKFPERGALLVGDNAQGKTSILEAVCMLVRLQSPRVKRPKPMVRIESQGFGIAGECWSCERQVKYGRGGLQMKMDGEEVTRQAEYFSDGGLIVWMGNDDLEMVRGVSEVRRRYLDFIGCQMNPNYRSFLSKYRRALKVRNLLLKDNSPREAEISAYDTILIETGDYLTEARSELVSMLDPMVDKAQKFVGKGKESVGLNYKSGSKGCMKTSLEAAFETDRARSQTTVGPHRDDLKLLLNNLPSADYASEGQQRTLALALKLAQGEMLQKNSEKLPIYLLDDIFGELDPSRRNAVMEYLPQDAQVLITTTHLDWLDEKWSDWSRFRVENGQISY